MKLAKQIFSLALVTTFMATGSLGQPAKRPHASDANELPKAIRRFSPTLLTANTARLSPGDRRALAKIIAAAKYMDALFLRQVWSGNDALKKELEADKTPLGRLLL